MLCAEGHRAKPGLRNAIGFERVAQLPIESAAAHAGLRSQCYRSQYQNRSGQVSEIHPHSPFRPRAGASHSNDTPVSLRRSASPCYRCNMASLNGPRLRRVVPREGYAASMATVADLSNRMFQQPEPTPSSLAANPATGDALPPVPAAIAPPAPPQRIPRWLERLELFLRIMLRMYIGLAICYAPWSHRFWDMNPLFLQFPALQHFAVQGAVRGMVSGLGLLNLWIALHDAIRQQDR